MIPHRWIFWGKFMVSSCMLTGGCRIRFLMCTPCCTLDRWWFGLKIIEMLLGLSTSCVFPLQLYDFLPRTHNWLFFPLISTSYLGLRHPAATTCGWFPPLQAVSSDSLCNAFLEQHDHASFFELTEEDCFGHVCIFNSCDASSPEQLHLKQDGLYVGKVDTLEDFFVWRI